MAVSFDKCFSRSADEIGPSRGGRLIYSSCGELSLSFSKSNGLAVAFK
jgi:hypothetical protein